MRALLNVSAILFPTLFLSTAAAVAQTGEFAAAIPGYLEALDAPLTSATVWAASSA
jgi:hypothetical protein